MTPFLKKIIGMNWVLVICMYGLLFFGYLVLESATRNVAGFEDPVGFFQSRQRIWILLGSVVYFGTALTNYRWVYWLGLPMYLVGMGMLLMVMVKGNVVHQISIAGINFQPTQLIIAAGIILIGVIFQYLPRSGHWWHVLAKIVVVGIITGLPFLLVMKNGDMGSAIVWIPVAVIALLIGGIPFRYLSFLGLIVLGIVPLIYYLVLPVMSERGTERIELYLDMLNGREVDITDEAYAPYWVSTAVGKAGWKGLGHNAPSEKGSLQAKGFIPRDTAHNDYIFAVIAEEHGFRGSLLLITTYTLLLIQCIFIAFYSRDFTGQIIAAGVVALFFAHIFENIGMCVLLMPITGIPLPLISYSGTFTVISMFLLGLVQSIWVHRKAEPSKKAKKNLGPQPKTIISPV